MAPGRRWVTEHRLLSAFVAAAVSTHLATVTGYWFAGIGLTPLDFNLFNGFLLLPNGTTDFYAGESLTTLFIIGGVFHYMTGISYGLVYAFLIYPLLPFKATVLGNIGKGLIWGMILAVISAGWWVPILHPAFNLGTFTTNAPSILIGIFVWHAWYGINLGALYSPLPVPETSERPVTESAGQTAAAAPIR